MKRASRSNFDNCPSKRIEYAFNITQITTNFSIFYEIPNMPLSKYSRVGLTVQPRKFEEHEWPNRILSYHNFVLSNALRRKKQEELVTERTVVPCAVEASVLDLMKWNANYKIAVNLFQQSLEGYTRLSHESWIS